jgi:hypothetical protein
MVRTIFPTKTLKTVEVAPFRANLKRWEHFEGQWARYAVEIWEGWSLVSRKVTAETPDFDVDACVEQMKKEVAVLVAMRALGLSQPSEVAELKTDWVLEL